VCRHRAGADELFLWIKPDFTKRIADEIDFPVNVDFENHFDTTDPVILQLSLSLMREAQFPNLGGSLLVEALSNQLIEGCA
jgi:hypothetical protein